MRRGYQTHSHGPWGDVDKGRYESLRDCTLGKGRTSINQKGVVGPIVKSFIHFYNMAME
jgi:hypothetical protein